MILVGAYLTVGVLFLSAWAAMGDNDWDAWDFLIVFTWPLMVALFVVFALGGVLESDPET